jgi:hypothetical protein
MSVDCMAIQFDRQVSCDEFDGLAVAGRPEAVRGPFEFAAWKQTVGRR